MPRDDSPYGAVASVEQTVPRFGRVKFTARRMRSKRGTVNASLLVRPERGACQV